MANSNPACLEEMPLPSTAIKPEPSRQQLASRVWKALKYSRFCFKSLYVVALIVRAALFIVYSGCAIKCSLKSRSVTFFCGNHMFVACDFELEFLWLLLSIANILYCLMIVVKWHGLKGLKRLLSLSIRRPGQWVLAFLFLTTVVSFCLLLNKDGIEPKEVAMLCLFEIQIIVTSATVIILNYTNVSEFVAKSHYARNTRILVKVTHLLVFIEFFTLFLIGSLQLGMEVTGLEKVLSDEFHQIFYLLRHASELFLYHKISMFLWAKLFLDENDILSNFPIEKEK